MPMDPDSTAPVPTGGEPTAAPDQAADQTAERSAEDWQSSLQKLYSRKSAERQTAPKEGDPRRFRATAAALAQEPDPADDAGLVGLPWNPAEPGERLTYEPLALPKAPIGYPHWRQIVGESFLQHQIIRHQPQSQSIQQVLSRAAWEVLQQFGTEAAYVFLLFAAHASDARQPWDEIIELRGTELIQLYIWTASEDLSPGRRLKRLGNVVELIGNLTILISQIDPLQKRFAATKIPLWVLEELEYSGPLSDLDEIVDGSSSYASTAVQNDSYQPEEAEELIIRVGLGLWVEQFGAVSEAAKQVELRTYGLLAKNTLQINPHKKPMAAKLAIFMGMMQALHPGQRFEVGQLLGQLESKSTILEMQRRKDRRNYIFSRWNTALRALKKLGWTIEFDAQTYPLILQPAWNQEETPPAISPDESDLWLNCWLKAVIEITPPAAIRTVEPETPEALEAPMPDRLTGRILERALELKGLSRAKLAEQLNLDRSMVTYWIKGARLIQPKHREQICELLSSELEQVLQTSR
jgi:hypothetical protein